MQQIVVIGGGLAGLLSSILLSRAGLKVTLVEQKIYPFHRVCGEYISHEVTPFLKSLGLYPQHLDPVQIDTLKLSTPAGRVSTLKLPMGGFGISRFQLDHFWYQQALDSGVICRTGCKVDQINFHQELFEVHLNNGESLNAQVVIGAFGKRSLLDRQLQRPFMKTRSPYVGVKYHIRYPWNRREIALHSFAGGYCGISCVEDNRVNLCYLTHRNNLKESGSVAAMEQQILTKNPRLSSVVRDGQRLFKQPMVINEVSFAPKKAVHQHVLMAGDAAGLITPLCGNGMAMAIRSAHLLSSLVVKYFKDPHYERKHLELEYQKRWSAQFAYRLKVGRKLQEAFHLKPTMELLVLLARWPWLGRFIVKQTHGEQFQG